MSGWLSTLSPSEASLSSRRQLIVFEAEGCVYCRVFRRDVLPEYEQLHSDGLPIRFLDVNEIGSLESDLASPLTVVPTAVVMVDGREVGRITGYTGKAPFLQMVRAISEAR